MLRMQPRRERFRIAIYSESPLLRIRKDSNTLLEALRIDLTTYQF
jgi:hypothetical protein